jgi:hypothetical protein
MWCHLRDLAEQWVHSSTFHIQTIEEEPPTTYATRYKQAIGYLKNDEKSSLKKKRKRGGRKCKR